MDDPDRCTTLPYLLSPVALELALLKENKIVEAAYVHWHVLNMPTALYRSDTACDLVMSHTKSSDLRLPFCLTNLPEVCRGTWGWYEVCAEVALCGL